MASGDRPYEYCMGFVSVSEKYRSQFTDKWSEVMANFVVSADYNQNSAKLNSPYGNRGYGNSVYRSASTRRSIVLKDYETHKLVMTYASKLVRSLFGDMHHEYVRARPSGYEDWQKGQTCTRYLRYVFSLEGHFRTFVEAVVDMLIFGTAIIESPWKYTEQSVLARSITPTPFGIEDQMTRMTIPVYDDVCLRNIDPMDFYPDPSRYRIYEMGGCAKRFRINASEARRNDNYDQAKVEQAISKGTPASPDKKDSFRQGLDQPADSSAPPEFKEMIAYEYWGDVAKDVPLKDENGRTVMGGRGVITVINGISVRADLWPLADYCLPVSSFIINPVNGRFYGLAPAEVVRYDQSFTDAVKILLAEAIIRQVHPPIAYDSDAEFDVSKLREWRADTPIPIRGGPQSIGTLRYDANIQNGMALYQGLKVGIQEGSGALGAIQGQDGPDREAATVGNQRMQFAMDRPELAAMVLENDCLPPLAKSIIRRGQQFIEDDADLQRRIGMDPPASLNDLMGDFEVEFVGSRMSLNRQQKLQAYDRLVAMAQAMPAIQVLLPSVEITKEVVGELLELPEAAALIGQDPEGMKANVAAMMLGQKGGAAQNGVPQASEPAGMLPAQAAGA